MATVSTAIFVKEVTVIDPTTKKEVQVVIFKHNSGAMFGIDKTFIDECTDDDEAIMIADPLSNNAFVELDVEIKTDEKNEHN